MRDEMDGLGVSGVTFFRGMPDVCFFLIDIFVVEGKAGCSVLR